MFQSSLKVSQFFSAFRMLVLHVLNQNRVFFLFGVFFWLFCSGLFCSFFKKLRQKILFLIGLRLATSVLQFTGLSDFCIHYSRYPLLVDYNSSKYIQFFIFTNTIVKTLSFKPYILKTSKRGQ